MKNSIVLTLLILSLFSCKEETVERDLQTGCAEEFTVAPMDYSAQYVAIPDSLFERWLVDWKYDSDGEINGKMLMSDALKVTEMGVNSYSLDKQYITKDLTGIEYFRNLTKLSVVNCLEDSLDLSHNKELIEFSYSAFSGGGGSYELDKTLSYLKLGPSEKLKSLGISVVWMKEIDISGFPNLEKILISSTPLTTIYVKSKEQKERLVNTNTVILRNNQEVIYKVCSK